MDKNFIRVRSAKDIIICLGLIVSGTALVVLSTLETLNILGYFLISTAVLLVFFLKTGWKDEETGIRYIKSEIFLDKSAMHKISHEMSQKISATTIKSNENGNGLRLDIYHNKTIGKGYIQLFEYIPYRYEPCSAVYEHQYENLSEIIK